MPEPHELITELLSENQAESIEVLDVKNVTTLVDHIIICSGKNSRHTKSLAEKVMDLIKRNPDFSIQCKAEGIADGQWVLIDCDLFMVHIMLNDVREHYSIEKLWHGLIARSNISEN